MRLSLLFLALGAFPLTAAAPRDLRCEYLSNPLGIDALKPHLSWVLADPGRGTKQSAYQILVASSPQKLAAGTGDVWNSGKVASGDSIQVEYGGKPLESGRQYWWKVRSWTASGAAWSEPAWWEMGLLNAGDWNGARWIASPERKVSPQADEMKERYPAPAFRKQFELQRAPARARVYVCGLGYYELYLNGRKVGNHVLDPAQTDYSKRAFYAAYDITGALKPGRNAVAILLGDGWYDQRAMNKGKFSYGAPGAVALLRVEYRDGTAQTIATGADWRVLPSPIVYNQIYVGEVYDARRELAGWADAGFDDSKYPAAKTVQPLSPVLQAQPMPPIKVHETLPAVKRTHPKPGVWVYDLGQNIAGWAKLTVNAPAGTAVQMVFAEALYPDGTVNIDSTGSWLTGQGQRDIYICRGGGVETWEPRFTYHGFQYVQVSGLAGDKPPLSIEGKVVHTALEPAGTFECSNAMLNRIYRTALWTIRDNLHGVLSDCPHRERCGWTGDSHVAGETVDLNFDAAAFWNKYIGDIETSLVKGLPTAIAPGKRGMRIANPDWGAAVVLLPWYQYRYYGERRTLERQYENMKRFVEYMGTLAKGDIVSSGYGDWYDPPAEGPQAPSIPMPKNTPVEKTSTAYYFEVADVLSRAAHLLGHTSDELRFRSLANEVRAAFNARFFDKTGHTYGSQTANAMALRLGLVPEGERGNVADALVRDIMDAHSGHFSTGIHGAKPLYVTLSATGHGHVAETILTRTTYPSIGYLFSLGATTNWENWSLTNNHTNNPRSRNHPMNTGFAGWFLESLGGVQLDPEQPAYKAFVLRPDVRNDLSYVKASHRTPYGWIRSEWAVKGGAFEWNVAVPGNTTARLYVPAAGPDGITESGVAAAKAPGLRFVGVENSSAVFEAGSGTYRIHAPLPAARRRDVFE